MPENEFEKAKIQEVEHTGVKEFFIFGIKKDENSDSIDFHDWSGSYRYLYGSLCYFTKLIGEEEASKNGNVKREMPKIKPKLMPKIPPVEAVEAVEAVEEHLDESPSAQDQVNEETAGTPKLSLIPDEEEK